MCATELQKVAIGIGIAGVLALGACSKRGADEAETPATPRAAGEAGAAGGASGAGAGGAGASKGSAGTAGASGAGASVGGAGTSAGPGGAGAGSAEPNVPDAGSTSDPVPPAMARVPMASLSLETTMESPNVAPWFNVYRPMDMAATGEPLPVIVWANGGCFRSDFTWAPLFTRWASGGFVVLALTEGPDGAFVQSTAQDQRGLIDWALERSEYSEMLDHERIVAAGNSCGGITALALAAQDDRVTSVFVLSGSSGFFGADTAVTSAIGVPVGYVVGGSEDIAGANASADYDAFPDGVPAMIVSRSSGDHMTVSTDTMILPQVAEIALNWMDLTLYGTKQAVDALRSPTVCTDCDPGVWTLEEKHLETLER
jgi:hypothetical protein